MDQFLENNTLQSRRRFLLNSGMGIGASALASLVPHGLNAGQIGLHHKAKAKRVIFLFMAGGPVSWTSMTISQTCIKCLRKNCPNQLLAISVSPK